MAKSERDLKVILTLTEQEANDLYLHLNPKYHPNKCEAIKTVIKDALGYTPEEVPSL